MSPGSVAVLSVKNCPSESSRHPRAAYYLLHSVLSCADFKSRIVTAITIGLLWTIMDS